ncbi:MAG: hypothetical protein ACYTGK_17800, partial [Planctomycetota bacterium]
MRTLLLTTLILAAPLLAQEADEQEPPKRVEQTKPTKQDKAAEIRKLVETFFDGQDEQKIEELVARLRELYQADEVKLAFRPVESQQLRLVFGGSPQGGQETIAGSSDGTSYTLKSLGGGRYELTATQEVRDGESRQITDEGTLKELRKKYGFLKTMLGVGLYGGDRLNWGDRINWVQFTDTPTARLGVFVRPPSKSLSHHLELPTGAGLVVATVTKGSRAERLGLKEHDVLLRIDGDLIDSPDQLGKL